MQEVAKQYKNAIEIANKKLKELDKDIVITNNIIFTNQTEFYYIFKIYQNDVCIKKVKASNNNEYDKVFKDLATMYGANIIYNYTDLNINQLNYLSNISDDIRVNKDEIISEIFNRPLF